MAQTNPSLQLQAGVQVQNPVELETDLGPYATVAEANATIIGAKRFPGKKIKIVVASVPTEYWWSGGIADVNLIAISTGGGGGLTSFNGRTASAAVPTTGDYDAFYFTQAQSNAVYQAKFATQASNLIYRSGDVGGVPGFTSITYPDLNNSNTIATVAELNNAINSTSIAGWGDSLTYGIGANPGGYLAIFGNLSSKNTLNKGIPAESSSLVLQRFLNNPQFWKYSTIIWVGSNNIPFQSTILSDIATMVSSIGHNRYVIIGLHVPSPNPNPSTGYTQITNINAALSSVYGARFFDLQAYFQTQGDGSAGDNADIAVNVAPRSKRFDFIHFNPTGYSLLANKLFTDFGSFLNDIAPKVPNLADLSQRDYALIKPLFGNYAQIIGGSGPGYGLETVVNGTFPSFTGWTAGAGWAATGNKAVHTPGNNATLAQSISLGGLSSYVLTFTVSSYAGGNIVATLGGLPGQLNVTANGTYTYAWYNNSAGSQTLLFSPGSAFDGSLSIVSFKLLTSLSAPQVSINNPTLDPYSVIEQRSSMSTFSNVWIGKNSGAYAVTADNNTAVGNGALTGIITAINNVALGSSAGLRLTNGTDNVYVGPSAGGSAYVQFFTTFIGSFAGNLSTGNFNTAIGYRSAVNMTTGTNNCLGGDQTGGSLNTGSLNTGFGSGVGVGSNANFNSVYGALSGSALNSGGLNTILGANTGTFTNTGDKNIFIGFQNSTTNTVGGSNIIIGSYVDVAGTSLFGKLSIGNVLFGSGIYLGGVSSSTPIFNGSISVGVAVPTARLHLPYGQAAAGLAPIKISSQAVLATTAASGTGTIATITFTTQPIVPYLPGSTIVISGITPIAYNGPGVVTSATATSVSYSSSATGAQTVAGLITINQLLATPENGAIEYDSTDLFFTSQGVRRKLTGQAIKGNFTATGTATSTFTVTIPTQVNNTYVVTPVAQNAVSAASFYVTNQTTTTYDIVTLTALTGAVAFGWILVA